jgi:CheY-like chemotaxis protein
MLESPRRDRAVHAIYDSAKRQAQLIDELLDVARIMAGKLQLERTPLDLNAVVHAAVEVVQPTADGKRVHIAVDTDVVESPYFGDPARLQQIVWNLLANAVKFTPEDGAVHVRVSRRDDATEVTVTDTGQGIPAAFLASVFEPFRQADGSTTRSHGGLGLGLAIVKQLVDAHGGTITAESAGEGRGSTFVVRLPPVAMRSMHVAPAVAADEAVDTGSLAGVSVLVVDDDDQSREVVTAYLEQSGARVVTASNARDAFDLLHRERIDVLLADIAMPAEDGYGLLHRVRASPASRVATTPSIALTAFARDEDRRRALDAGFQLHLVKPIDAHALVTAVASFGKLSPT